MNGNLQLPCQNRTTIAVIVPDNKAHRWHGNQAKNALMAAAGHTLGAPVAVVPVR